MQQIVNLTESAKERMNVMLQEHKQPSQTAIKRWWVCRIQI